MVSKRRQWFGWGAALFAFAVFLFVALHRLIHSSLWLDEAIEFWYSRVMTGTLPFENGAQTSYDMLQRINSTFQPPLYNFLMFFWLQISESEWWFRFFGVVLGFVGMIGLYSTVMRISANRFLSAGAVLFASFAPHLVYYWQECAEYSLVLACLFWAAYFWAGLLRKPVKRDVIGLTVLSVLSVYSQYGAAFPVFVMLVSALILVLREKKKDLTVTLLISYGSAFLLAALPLFFFFLLKQFTNQHDGVPSLDTSPPPVPFLVSVGGDFSRVWNALAVRMPGVLAVILLAVTTAIAVLILLRCSSFLRRLILCCFGIFLLYYLAVKLRLYSYGNLGGRYALFLIPFAIVAGAGILHELLQLFSVRRPALGKILAAVTACLLAVFCVLSWNLKLKDNWQKEDDVRLSAALWYNEQAESENTIVYYGAASSFAYYIRRSELFSDQMESRLHYMNWYQRNLSAEAFRQYLDGIYGDAWPDRIYFVAGHLGSDLQTYLDVLTENGYKQENLNGLSLIRFIREDQS